MVLRYDVHQPEQGEDHSMRITEIKVTGLFGVFDHTIPLNQDDRITIIYGQNGYGKTFTLMLVYKLLTSSMDTYEDVAGIPFKSMVLTCDDGSVFTVNKHDDEDGVVLDFEYCKPDGTVCEQFLWDQNAEEMLKAPPWLVELKLAVIVRLFSSDQLTPNDTRFDAEGLPVLTDYGTDIQKFLQYRQTEYIKLSRKLDKDFSEHMDDAEEVEIDVEALTGRLDVIREKYDRLVSGGILDEGEINIDIMSVMQEINPRVMALYLNDAEQKLAVFDEFIIRIELLKSIVNRLFAHKTMNIDHEAGFIFTTAQGKKLTVSQLSSGEQRLVMLMFRLMFGVQPDTLVLIDEPELSFHIAWQQEFLQDLDDIIQVVGFDAVVATHSPQIIHDRWDLTVELKDLSA